MRFRKIYVEISNLCNLSCAFCPGTRRAPGRMTAGQFTQLLPKLKPYTEYLYFHLMGEPLCHPELKEFLDLAQDFKVILTTNGTLLARQQEILLSAPNLHKVNISLHTFEANDLAAPFADYLADCFRFGQAAAGKRIVVYRLWNQGGQDTRNEEILSCLEQYFPKPWTEKRQGIQIGDKVFLQHAEKFDWPDLQAEEDSGSLFCYGLRDQLGVLWDGTVVPCCLDHEGDIALGNLFTQDMEEILNSPRAKAIYDGFTARQAIEPLCRRCGYARRFR